MTQSLARAEPTRVLALRVFGSQERVDLIKEQIGRGWREPMSDTELEFIAAVCQKHGYDPLAKPPQVHFIKRWDSRLKKFVLTEQKAIDGTRLSAVRTREYAGQVGPQWTADGKEWLDVWLSEEPPAAARVGVLRKGFREPLWSVATWREWAQYDTDEGGKKVLAQFWRRMPANMLAKTAENMSLKRAFPEETDERELEAQARRWQLEDAQQAQRYTEIFGADEDHSAYELPTGRSIDYETGEVLDAQSTAQGLTGPERSSAVATVSPPVPAPPSDPVLVDKYRRNRELIAECRKRNIDGFNPLALGKSMDVVEEANLELEDRIARYDFENAEVARQKAKEGLR